MRRRGIKIVSLILTIVSVIILFLACLWTIKMYISMASRPQTDEINYGGIIYLFGLIGLFAMIWINQAINVTLIILNSIDIKKTKREGNSIKYSLIFLIMNIVLLVGDFAYYLLINPDLYSK